MGLSLRVRATNANFRLFHGLAALFLSSILRPRDVWLNQARRLCKYAVNDHSASHSNSHRRTLFIVVYCDVNDFISRQCHNGCTSYRIYDEKLAEIAHLADFTNISADYRWCTVFNWFSPQWFVRMPYRYQTASPPIDLKPWTERNAVHVYLAIVCWTLSIENFFCICFRCDISLHWTANRGSGKVVWLQEKSWY